MKKQDSKILFAIIFWFVTYVSCFLIIKETSPGKPLGIILSFLPILSFAYFIYSFVKGFSSLDEVEIRIQLEAAVIAFALAFLMIMTLGLLDFVVVLKKEDWSYRHLIPYFATFYFAGLLFSRRKYQ